MTNRLTRIVTPLLEIADLTTGYGKTPILRSVSLAVVEGACVGLIGPNGHGKTTLMRTVSGLHRAWSGSIRLRGTEVLGLAPERLVELGIAHVPQGDLLFGDMTVEEHLLIPLRRLKRPQRLAKFGEIYELFPRLGERTKQRVRTLSGGEKRMLALARGMLLGGSVLLIDEPSLGLAPRLVEVVYEQIRTLVGGGTTVLIVEETPARLRGLASRLHLLDRGVVVASGQTEHILADEALLETYLGLADESDSPRDGS